MIDQLRQIAIFAKTVDHGSFRSAAEALQLSPSVVSHHIAQLEQQLGVALLYRSTRKLSLTSHGEQLLRAAREMIEAAESGLSAITNESRQLSGELRVTMPAVLAQSALVDRIAAFATANPNVRLNLDFSDLRREIINDGIDVAIRMGWLRDSALKAKKLYDVERKLVASRSYLQTLPTPHSPRDVANWDWVGLAQVSIKPEFRKARQKSVRIRPDFRVSVNDAHALYRLAHAGAGLAILPAFLADLGISTRVLQHVLPDWTVDSVGVYAVWPPNAPKEGLTAQFIESLVRRDTMTEAG